ncbi:MAG TPA: ATP-binding protein, partial [Anaerolineales bacterium]|nr:ATP-binding protein [Anaerolineales bacterium]
MVEPQNVEVNVQGNISGNLVIGNHNIVVNNPNGGVVNVVAPLPPAEPRTRPVNLRPRNFPGLLDRTTEMEVLTQAIGSSAPVSLFGESGIGKTSFLRRAAHQLDLKTFTDGAIYLSVRGIARDDILQLIYDSFYVSPSNHKPTDGELRAKLNGVRAVILLDDVTLGREDASTLLDVMPQSLFVLSSSERMVWGEGQAISLDGLPEAEAIQLFEQELGRSITEDERPIVQKICKVLLMHPLRILQTASMIREDGLSIPQAFQTLTTTRTQTPTVEVALQKANDTQKKIFSVLAVAAGFGLTREHIVKLVGSAEFEANLKSLIQRGMVQEAGSSLSLSSDAAAALMRLWDLSSWEDALIQHFSNWLSTAPKDMLIDQASDLLFHLLKRTGEKKNWPQLVKLGTALERISILQKKWQRWVQILDLLRMA